MGTTTAAALRDRAATVIEALVPRAHARDTFRRYRDEGAGDLVAWAESDGIVAAFRVFQVRTEGSGEPPESSNHDIETHFVDLVVTVAYPHSARAGASSTSGPALERDDLIDLDRHDIETAIGLRGAANFTDAYSADATWRDGSSAVERGDACDFLVIRQRMSFARVMT